MTQNEIPQPNISTYPIEIFGTLYNDQSPLAQDYRNRQHCPYLNRECTKPRKSEPHIKVGICSVGYSGFLPTAVPNIICPHRFLDPNLFKSIKDFFYPEWQSFTLSSEVSMGVGGNVDYVLSNPNNYNDFLCVEIQANGTTGSPYNYVKEILTNGVYSGSSYTFGLNWANEFSKTMMQQAYKKGKIATYWGKKIVFIIQDVAMQYLVANMDTSALRQNREDSIHFLMYKMVWSTNEGRFCLQIDSWKSTSTDGISRMLGGADTAQYPDIEDFINTVRRRII